MSDLDKMHSDVKVDCFSTLGKRKVSSLDRDSMHKSELDVTLVNGWAPSATLWLTDKEGRQVGVIIRHDNLIALTRCFEEFKAKQIVLEKELGFRFDKVFFPEG